MAENNQVGLVTFDDAINITIPIGPLAENRFAMADAVHDMQSGGQTALYDAIIAGHQDDRHRTRRCRCHSRCHSLNGWLGPDITLRISQGTGPSTPRIRNRRLRVEIKARPHDNNYNRPRLAAVGHN